MKKQISSYLEDILKYSKHIVSQSSSLTRDQFQKDFNIQLSLIRCLEVIGEVSKRLRDADSAFYEKYPEIPWKSMARMRDLLIHHYEDANLDIVWDTIMKDIPVLEIKAKKILEEYNAQK
ncbi:MAG: hypothetical protein A3A86_02305 [Elusimicrobia bacterium RIFCSPLOWO2_01_FULL_60_11]|nr:MAG: hypothetical protein A3A86_02305 [Elusimicrobia bacterium RIFCSPLOWO2_01_FULL_60_11]